MVGRGFQRGYRDVISPRPASGRGAGGEGFMNIRRSQERSQERIAFARSQRKQANEFSLDVWQMVRAGRMLGEKFRREYPLGSYTLDFVCIELKLNIEIDGKDHLTEEGTRRDAHRDAYLRRLGYTIIRIHGFRVTRDPMSVRNEIEEIVLRLRKKNPSPPAPLPFVPQGRGEPDQTVR